MLVAYAFPVFPEKNNIVLPERRPRRPFSYQVIVPQNPFYRIDLKVVCFLETDHIGLKVPEKRFKSLLSHGPAVGPVISKTKAKVQAHHFKSIIDG